MKRMVPKQCLQRLNMADEATHVDTTCNFGLDVTYQPQYAFVIASN